MNNKYEQLVEFIINDETDKARELFHQIVVEKSRDIYENLVAEEDLDEVGGNEVEELVDEISLDEEGISEEEEGEEGAEELAGAEEAELGAEEGDAEELEDRVVDLEDAIDDLRAEFEKMMGDEGDDMGMGGDDMDMEIAGDDMAGDNMEEMMPMAEAISLKAAPKPVTSEEGGVYKKSAVAANSGAKGAVASPVKMTGDTAQGRPAPKAAEIGVGSSSPKQGPAPKPVTSQASGVNTKTPFPKG